MTLKPSLKALEVIGCFTHYTLKRNSYFAQYDLWNALGAQRKTRQGREKMTNLCI